MKYSEIIDKVAKELNLPIEVVNKTYHAYWSFIRETIESLPLKRNISMEDFAILSTNFNIPSLGKLTCTYDRVIGIKNKYEFINQIKNKNERIKN